jgi:hypothetical protein
VDPTKLPTKDYQPKDLPDHGNVNDAPDQHDWWNDADVSGVIDLKAFSRFLYNYDRLLEDSSSEDDSNESTLHTPSTDATLAPPGDPEPGQSPPMKQ